MVRHRPADDAPAEHVKHHGQIQKPLTGREWSKRQGVVELFPCLSSPNRTCTSQRIRLSIQVSLKAKTIYRRSQRASVGFHAASHQFAWHFTDYQRSSPHCGQLIRQANHSDCLPSPCGRLSRSRTTTEAPPACTSSGAHSLGICASLPQFTCWTQRMGEVAYRSLYPCFPQVVADVMV